MKRPLIALGLVATTAMAISQLSEEQRARLSGVARTVLEH